MSNEKQETIADIVSEMREFADTDSQTIGRDVLRRCIQKFAKRIEAAAKRECEATREKSSQVGNVAKMREALENCASMGEQIDYQLGSSEETVYALRHERCIAHNISECARAALSAPPRNCDVLSKAEVLEMLKDRSFSKEDTIEWLYDKAKGGAEWMV